MLTTYVTYTYVASYENHTGSVFITVYIGIKARNWYVIESKYVYMVSEKEHEYFRKPEILLYQIT